MLSFHMTCFNMALLLFQADLGGTEGGSVRKAAQQRPLPDQDQVKVILQLAREFQASGRPSFEFDLGFGFVFKVSRMWTSTEVAIIINVFFYARKFSIVMYDTGIASSFIRQQPTTLASNFQLCYFLKLAATSLAEIHFHRKLISLSSNA